MKLLIPVIILSLIPMAYAMYSDIPDSPEVHFTADIPQYAWIQEDYTIKLTAVDDRSVDAIITSMRRSYVLPGRI